MKGGNRSQDGGTLDNNTSLNSAQFYDPDADT